MEQVILGISAFNHDASACLLTKDDICFAEEERFTREKHTSKFPVNAMDYCFKQMNLSKKDVTHVAFYFDVGECWKNYFSNNIPAILNNHQIIADKRYYYELVWLLNFKNKIKSIRKYFNNKKVKIEMVCHHDCHAWYAYYASQFSDCIVLSNDSMGERTGVNAFQFSKDGEKITCKNIIKQYDPHSVGYLYGAVTEFFGFKRGSDEGKVMALASYGTDKYLDYFRNGVELKPGGRFKLNNSLIQHRTYQPKGQRLSNEFLEKFGEPKKSSEKITQFHYDIAYALQKVSEEIVTHQVSSLREKNIVLTGGVALNSVINGLVCNRFKDKHIFVPAIPNDGGCSIGAAIYLYFKNNNVMPKYKETTFLGNSYTDDYIKSKLDSLKIKYTVLEDPISEITTALANRKVVGCFKGNMESGPRALCNRSILASPQFQEIRDYLNNSVKYRESFRPYGGFLLEQDVKEVLEYNNEYVDGPYMSFVYNLKNEWKAKIPSLCHVDGTCRVQIIKEDSDSFLENLLKTYKSKYNIPILINTSLNLGGFPIARTVEDAVMTFSCSAMDMMLFNERILITK